MELFMVFPGMPVTGQPRGGSGGTCVLGARGLGHLPCPEGWHIARIECLLPSSMGLQRCLGSSACKRWPIWVQWSSLEWYESSENSMAREQKAPQL